LSSDETRKGFHEKDIIIPTQTSTPPLFNYTAFVRSKELTKVKVFPRKMWRWQ
jgi:hypothetical protein